MFGVGVYYVTQDRSRSIVCQVRATDEDGGLATDGKGTFELTSIDKDPKISNGYLITGNAHSRIVALSILRFNLSALEQST